MESPNANLGPGSLTWRQQVEQASPQIKEAVERVWNVFKPHPLEAADLFQAVITKLLQWQERQDQTPQNIVAMATATARNLVSDFLRHKQVEVRPYNVRHIAEIHNDLRPRLDVEQEDDLQMLLDMALQKLAPDERDLMREKFFSNRTLNEIAQSQGISEQAVFSRIKRILVKLRSIVLERAAQNPKVSALLDAIWPVGWDEDS